MDYFSAVAIYSPESFQNRAFMAVCREQNQIASLNAGYEGSWIEFLY